MGYKEKVHLSCSNYSNLLPVCSLWMLMVLDYSKKAICLLTMKLFLSKSCSLDGDSLYWDLAQVNMMLSLSAQYYLFTSLGEGLFC